MEELKIPLGIKDFRKIAKEGYIFADKSLLIKDIMSSGSESILFTRPRRFGKTLALSMLDRFFNIAYKEEEMKDDTFAGLKISKCREYAKWKQDGTKNGYPVLRLDMSVIEFDDIASFISQFEFRLKKIVKKSFKELLSNNPDPYAGLLYMDNRNEFKPGSAVSSLCQEIESFYGTNPIILIDEYDKPLESSYGQPWFEDFARMYGDFMRTALKGNLNVDRVIITGTQRIVVKGLFSSLNDIDHVGVLNPYYSEYFGITSEEMKDLLAQRVEDLFPGDVGNARLIKSKFDLAKSWYDGYHIGGKEIFNPWSAMNFLQYNINDDNVRPYWNDTAEHNILVMMFSETSRSQLDGLKQLYVSGKKIFTASFMEVTPLWKEGSKLDKEEMLSLLLFAGYLTADTTENGYLLSIPNMEVRLNFDELMERVYCFDIPCCRTDETSHRKECRGCQKRSGTSYERWFVSRRLQRTEVQVVATRPLRAERLRLHNREGTGRRPYRPSYQRPREQTADNVRAQSGRPGFEKGPLKSSRKRKDPDRRQGVYRQF